MGVKPAESRRGADGVPPTMTPGAQSIPQLPLSDLDGDYDPVERGDALSSGNGETAMKSV